MPSTISVGVTPRVWARATPARARAAIRKAMPSVFFMGAPLVWGLRIHVHGVDDVLVLEDRKSTRLNCSHGSISYAVFCLQKNKRSIARARLARRSRLRKICTCQRLGQLRHRSPACSRAAHSLPPHEYRVKSHAFSQRLESRQFSYDCSGDSSQV